MNKLEFLWTNDPDPGDPERPDPDPHTASDYWKQKMMFIDLLYIGLYLSTLYMIHTTLKCYFRIHCVS